MRIVSTPPPYPPHPTAYVHSPPTESLNRSN